ncbi:MAG: bifunctional 4-hydroxy-2-oxoglutarate aldolase/2-dehydro-3-deoxy-phosphogluconate aldolase [Deinococcota bacterium]|nr:bifunctional 4-hydroxy-2-oxoglutarate aldolase/2-dehydro-3-deoxy-phosphogluconate aldolase [Deinococcota bacterium]
MTSPASTEAAAEAATIIREAGVIAILRGDFPLPRLLRVAEALLRGGVGVLELTLNSQGALAGVAALRRELAGQLLVGAGTVRTADDADRALDAGAQFLVSPNLDLASALRAQARGVLHLPGVFTASEAQAAWAAGCRLVKLFPADSLGPSYLRALRAPLDDIGFIPTGGVGVDNVAAYVAAGAVAVGVGSTLVRGASDEEEALTDRAHRLVSALRRAREGELDG